MKANIEYDLTDKDQKDHYYKSIHASAYYNCLVEMLDYLYRTNSLSLKEFEDILYNRKVIIEL